jgi:hypothetical protein
VSGRRTAQPQERFVVVDLGTQIDALRRFAVWDTTVARFWKINNHQTWLFVDDLVADFAAVYPDKEKFQDIFNNQCATIAELAVILGFDRDLSA